MCRFLPTFVFLPIGFFFICLPPFPCDQVGLFTFNCLNGTNKSGKAVISGRSPKAFIQYSP
ncbi:hypothetical protein BJV82DRAFT_556199 [Fennellomyces sp. T-0311]|nr:hypothetical protein BJV82DRAFT_556199 [Fennellomyces sp. T-0311]